jgi:hypothetical protein
MTMFKLKITALFFFMTLLAACSSTSNLPLEATAAPGSQGYIYFIANNPAQPKPWRAWRLDPAVGTYQLIYEDTREIQSICGTASGNYAYFNMLDTTTGNFVIYGAFISTTPQPILLLTPNTTITHRHVSCSADGSIVVWSQGSGKDERVYVGSSTLGGFIRNVNPLINSAYPVTMPTISASGKHTTFVILRPDSNVVGYRNLDARVWWSVLSSASKIEHPSVSNDLDFLWLTTTGSGSIRIVRKNCSIITVTSRPGCFSAFTVLADNTGIKHPFLISDGTAMTFGLNTDNAVYTKTLDPSGSPVKRTTPNPGVIHKGMYWQYSPQ